jgi:hypothetical protein
MNVLLVFIATRRTVGVAIGVARADQGQLVGMFADLRKIVRDHQAAFSAGAELAPSRREEAHLAAAGVGKRLTLRQLLARILLQRRLVVERVDVAGPAVHHQKDATPRGSFEMRRLGRQSTGDWWTGGLDAFRPAGVAGEKAVAIQKARQG